jgi:hypothetical protein
MMVASQVSSAAVTVIIAQLPSYLCQAWGAFFRIMDHREDSTESTYNIDKL